MVIEVDGDTHVKIKLAVFWAICVTLITAAVYTAYTVSQFNSQLDSLTAASVSQGNRIEMLERSQDNFKTYNQDVNTRIAVLDTKISNIDSNIKEIKETLKSR